MSVAAFGQIFNEKIDPAIWLIAQLSAHAGVMWAPQKKDRKSDFWAFVSCGL